MLDTNVLVSALAFPGPERQLLEAVRKHHTLLINDYLLEEVREVLARKFPGKARILDALLRTFRVEKLPIPPGEKVGEARPHLRDPDDAAVVASVLLARPDVFVSGDKDLHTPQVLALIRVHTTSEALALLEAEKE
ncbi:MAG: putative toxin-antitoxin system toxin component, PIN family [Bacillota bacterium]